MIYPTISIRQPWAWAILNLDKDVENRSWKLPKRFVDVPVLIHAGKKVDKHGLEYLDRMTVRGGLFAPHELPLGGIVGVMTFTGFTGCCGPDSDWAEKGLYLQWRIGKADALPFFACKGQLGFFDVDYPFSLLGGWQ